MASVDRSVSVKITSSQAKKSPAFDVYTSALVNVARENYSVHEEPLTSVGPVFNGEDLGATYNVQTGLQSGLPSTIHTYKMRGYYAAGATYETWVSIGSPSVTPPSGHTLLDVEVVGQI
jgi:hypothetical protein